eukprot:2782982-Amphidinium_carterae.1
MCSFGLLYGPGMRGGEAKFLGKAQLMPQSLATSVTAAVEALNDAEFQCTNGFCVVFDATLYKVPLRPSH